MRPRIVGIVGTIRRLATRLVDTGERMVRQGISWLCEVTRKRMDDKFRLNGGRPMFIAVDGIDGAGKTTLVRQLEELLHPLGVVVTKEPTDESKWGQIVRAAASNGRLPRDEEITYFHKDRLHHIEAVIRPALEQGKTVISDRYVDSMLAFQADSPEQADELYERYVSEIIVPDVTFILDCPVQVGLERIRRSRPSFSQYEKEAVLERAARIYETRQGENYIHLDASKAADDTFHQAADHLIARLRVRRSHWASRIAARARGEGLIL